MQSCSKLHNTSHTHTIHAVISSYLQPSVLCLQCFAFSALMLLVGQQDGHLACKKTKCWDAGMVMCQGHGADLHMAQLMPLQLTISCSSKSRLVLPFWCWLTQVVPDKIQEVSCMCVICMCTAINRQLPTFQFKIDTKITSYTYVNKKTLPTKHSTRSSGHDKTAQHVSHWMHTDKVQNTTFFHTPLLFPSRNYNLGRLGVYVAKTTIYHVPNSIFCCTTGM